MRTFSFYDRLVYIYFSTTSSCGIVSSIYYEQEEIITEFVFYISHLYAVSGISGICKMFGIDFANAVVGI